MSIRTRIAGILFFGLALVAETATSVAMAAAVIAIAVTPAHASSQNAAPAPAPSSPSPHPGSQPPGSPQAGPTQPQPRPDPRGPRQPAAPQPGAAQPGTAPADPQTTLPQAAAPVPDPSAPPIPPGELTRLFDAYAILQAQNFLKLDDDQYGEFVVRLKALQDGRRKHLGERSRLIGELRRLTAPDSTATDAAIRAAFDALQREDAAAHADLAKAYENLDSVLDPRQQARFRVFEDQIERQKLSLLSRVRRRAAQNPKP